MKKLILFLFLISFVITNISCKKLFKKHTIVEGKVINYGSKQPIEGVLVVLQDGIQAGGLTNSKTSSGAKSEVTTDANGHFEVELYGEYDACLYCNKTGYTFEVIIQGATQGVKGYNTGTNSNQILEMKAEAYFSPLLKSKSNSNSDDYLVFEMLKLYNGNYQSQNNLTFSGKGPFDYDYKSLVLGDSYVPYRITLTRQGNKTVKIDSVYIKSLETYRDTIYY